MAYILLQAVRNGETFHRFSIFYCHDWAKCSVFHILVLLFNLHTESKILTFENTNEKPDVLTNKVFDEKFI